MTHSGGDGYAVARGICHFENVFEARDETVVCLVFALVASAMPDYYGNVAGTATLRLRHRLGHDGRFWLSLAADVTTFRYVANAVVTSTAFSFGPATLGLHRSIGAWENTAASLYGRAFEEYGARALWNMRPAGNPTRADALAITQALRTYGRMDGRKLAERIEELCRAHQ